ncbi:3-hydroxymethyl-3-methylglutaryl-CoA lyase [Rhizophlyctis rosea]|uniref:hydroxymethylglutaryl-CoA lyase n=1 Tax=Rhizophlyctis rosea TaxID=64517 RepID=A0AAD5S3R9_9FUNG|nr:3-hydroxymethyl-3-methylglutaryl-CoA lyase [Rhizophlyctis rosea]
MSLHRLRTLSTTRWSQLTSTVPKRHLTLPTSYKYDPSFVRLVDVSPRDGLQNERTPIPTPTKITLINKLTALNIPVIESTSFVSPKWVPQLSDAAAVMQGISKKEGTSYPVLTPNLKGLERALELGVEEVAVFPAVTEGFSKRNLNAGVEETLGRFGDVIAKALENGVRVRGYVSVVLGCPYEGDVSPSSVARVAERLFKMGCYEISLGDTIGTGTPNKMRELLKAVCQVVPVENLAVHCHDTYGQALGNIYEAINFGVRVVDSSVAGLGGCPYAKGATGNVATEDVLYLVHGMGLRTGVDLNEAVKVGNWISGELGRKNASRVANALTAKL